MFNYSKFTIQHSGKINNKENFHMYSKSDMFRKNPVYQHVERFLPCCLVLVGSRSSQVGLGVVEHLSKDCKNPNQFQ